MDYWRYLPPHVFIIICLCTLFITILWYYKKRFDAHNKITKTRILIPLFCAFFGALVFYLFRVALFFLGDGYIMINSITGGYRYRVEEPLDIYIHSIIYQWLHSNFSVDAAQTYALISIACGVIFVFVLIYFIKKLGETPHQQWTTVFALCTSGTMLLFFGYVESYSIVTVLVLVFFLSGLSYCYTYKHMYSLACTHLPLDKIYSYRTYF